MSPVNIVVINEGRFGFVPAMSPSYECAMVLINNGTAEDYDFAEYLNAHIVEFEKDPAFA